MRRRLILVAVLFIFMFLGVAARLVGIQAIERDRWMDHARRIQEGELIQAANRGRIFDRNGVLLAQDLPAVSIAIDNYHMSRPEVLVELLHQYLGLSKAALADKVYKEGYFTWIARQVDVPVANALQAEARQRGVSGVITLNEPKRVYPQGALGSNVIGFTGLDHQGLEGVELSLDEWLAGKDAVYHVRRTASGVELVRRPSEDGGPGADVFLTLDARIQRVAEQKLDAGIARFQAKDGFVVILDPHTGELLAMAQARRYDLNDYRRSGAGQRLNQPLARAYEPGSLFKVFSGLAALETQAVSLDQRFDGDTKIRIAGHAFGNAEDHVKFGWVNLKEIIQNSINIGMIQVAQRVGEQAFYRYLTQVGFGRTTGIDLPGELTGSVIPVERWSPLEIGAIAIGQAVSVTGIQLASRMAALGNEGRLMQPHVLLEVRDPDGRLLHQTHPRMVGRVASLLNTQLMREMMEAVVEAGSGMAARLDGFAVAAKSGTAQKAVPGRGYLPDQFISSFGGFFPAQDPRYLILVMMDEVGVRPVWGGQTAAVVFKEIAERLIVLEKLHPDIE